MHESGTQTEPEFPANWIEWGFKPGDLALVAAIPNESGDLELFRVDAFSPTDYRQREFLVALLNIAHRLLAESEPTNKAGMA